MQILRSAAVLSIMALVLVFANAGRAHAIVFGNFSPDINSGESTIGIGLSDDQVAAMYDLGIGQGVLGFMAGTLDLGTGVSGSEFGVSYKHKLGEVFKVDKFPVKMGVLGSYRRGTVETTILGQTFEWDLTRIDLGLGASMSPLQKMNVFAAVLYERATYQVTLPFIGEQDVTDSGTGFLGGAEYWVTPKFVAGAEIHSGLYSNDLGLYAAFKF